MSDYFGDASYWIALVNRDDEFHEPAARYSTLMKLENARIVTTQLVLNEVLNPRSGSSSQQRQDNIDLIDRISRNQQVEIVPQSPEQFSEALELLRARTDDKPESTEGIRRWRCTGDDYGKANGPGPVPIDGVEGSGRWPRQFGRSGGGRRKRPGGVPKWHWRAGLA